MDKLVLAFGPLFAAGFAVQQLLEIVTSFLDVDSNPTFQKYKKAVLGAISLGVGFWLASSVDQLLVLKAMGVNAPWLVDVFVTALVLSAGTDGVNSILKFLKYSKENKKNTAASKDPSNAGAAAAALGATTTPGIPTAAALQKMNRQ